MQLILKNKKFRYDVIIRFINDIGEYLFNAVFMIYAANVYQSELAVSFASAISMFPIVFELIAGVVADGTRNKKKYIYMIGWIQAGLFIIAYFVIRHNSFLTFAILSLVNFSSDSVGVYLNNLEYTFFNKIVAEDDIYEASLFNQVSYRVKALIGPALGVWLLRFSNNNYALITVINSMTFVAYAVFVHKIYSDLEEPKVIENESIRIKIKEIYNNLLNIFSVDGNDNKEAIKLMVTGSLAGGIATAVSNMVMVSFVKNPLFNFGFDEVFLYTSTISTMVAISSGLFSKDIFAKYDVKKLYQISNLILMSAIIAYSLNTDISRIIGFLFSYISFYIRLKTGPRIMSNLYKNVEEGRLSSVASALTFINLISLPLITSTLLTLYNINKTITWIITSLLVLINILYLYKKER